MAAALATLVIRLAVCGRNQLNPNMRTPRTCPPASPSLPSLPSLPPPLSVLHLLAPLCNFPLQLVIASYIAYYPRTKRSFHSLLFPSPPSGNTFPATPDMSEEDDDVLLGSAIRFQLQLRHIALLLRLLCHLMRRLFLPAVPPPLPLSSSTLSLSPLCLHCLCLLLCALSLATFSVSISAVAKFCDCHELLHSTQAAA